MEKIETVSELKALELQVLIKVHEFCIENDIKYFLYFGSLIGAVRHKGFIPWDDDVDIAMPRPDYERFISTFSSADLELAHCQKNKKYICSFAKVYFKNTILREDLRVDYKFGVGIDIFPIDSLPERRSHKREICRIKYYKYILSGKIFKLDSISKSKRCLIRIISAFYSANYVCRKIDSIGKSVTYGSTNLAGVIVWGNPSINVLPISAFENIVSMEFEKYILNVPKEYDMILTNIYGDYMQFPPVEKQINEHNFEAYYI